MKQMVREGDRIGEYFLVEPIGHGGFSQVWRARHHVLDREVAIKISRDPAFVAELRNGGMLQADLQHPAIVSTIGMAPHNDPPYLVMELIEGESLGERLTRRGRLGTVESVEIARQILLALQHAHERGVVHRDLKPDNILLYREEGRDGVPRVKVTDFGLGTVANNIKTSLMLSGEYDSVEGKSIVGTIEYMAPEQKQGNSSSPAVDIYAFGVIFYEMLMGRTPQGAFSYPSESHSDIPSAVDTILAKCLAPSANSRYQRVEPILEEIDHLLESGVKSSPLEAAAAVTGTGISPFEFRNGQEAHSLLDLVKLSDRHWEDAKVHLYRGDYERWLRSARQKALSRTCMKIRETQPDQDVGLETFLEETGLIAMPRVELDTESVDLGTVIRSETRTVKLFLHNYSRGMFWGTVRPSEDCDWIHIESSGSSEVVNDVASFKGREHCVHLRVETAALQPNQQYEGRVVIDTQVGTLQAVIRLRIAPRPGRVHVRQDVLEVFYTDHFEKRTLELEFENVGDLPAKVQIASPHPSLNVVEESFTVDENLKVKIEFDASKIAPRELRPAKCGTRFMLPIVEVLGPTDRRKIPVSVYHCPTRHVGSIVLGTLMGAIPLLGELFLLFTGTWIMTLKLRGFDKPPHRNSQLEKFETFSIGKSFLIGIVIGVILHILPMVALMLS